MGHPLQFPGDWTNINFRTILNLRLESDIEFEVPEGGRGVSVIADFEPSFLVAEPPVSADFNLTEGQLPAESLKEDRAA